MVNTMTKFKAAFEPRYQDILGKSLTAMKIASTRLDSQLTWGKVVERAKIVLDGVVVRDISSRQVDRTVDNISDSSETLTIDQEKGATFAVADWDKLQNGPLQFGEVAGKEIALKLKRYIDADVYSEVTNAYKQFGDGDIAGTTGNAITLTTTNAAQVFSNALATLQANNVEGKFAVSMDPMMGSILNQTIIGKSIELAGTTLKNGYAGSIIGFDTYLTNNLKWTGILNVATTATAADTVTIGGVVFTFVTPIGATAGNVLLGANATASRQNLIAAINGAAGAGTTYVEVSAADRAKLNNLRITATESGTTIVLSSIGGGRVTYSETLTAAADIFSKTGIHAYMGKPGGIDLVLQQGVKTTFRDEPKQKTTNVLCDALYGKKTFADGAQTFLDLFIAA